eukprot:TRINITY_DN915_c0_g1_i1.p2 TRINITY_DN915_c0_g1~~TRINITY_DN915_c0_g1_i1.p2  ORF type:complete len:395 (-),score=50.67 TRINITY_DN915_c0_g1_i1:2172-3356(-)
MGPLCPGSCIPTDFLQIRSALCRVLCIFILLICSQEVLSGTQGLPALVKKVKQSVVTIDVFDSEKTFIESGSGFFVTPELVVSSRHVFWKHRNDPTRTQAGGSSRKATAAHFAQTKTNDRRAPHEYSVRAVLLDDRESDIIVLQIDNPNPSQTSLNLASEVPDEGEDIFVISSPQGLEGVVTTGIVSALHNDIDMQISASIGKGSSGAPVFNYDGEVVAIVNGFLTSGQNMNFAINVNRLKFLLSHLIGNDGANPSEGQLLTAGSLTIPQWVAQQKKEEEAHINATMPATPGFSIRKIFMNIHDLTRQMLWGSPQTQQTHHGDHPSEIDILRLGNNRSAIAKPSTALVDPKPSATSEQSCNREDAATDKSNNSMRSNQASGQPYGPPKTKHDKG